MEATERSVQSNRSYRADFLVCFAPRRSSKPHRLRSSSSTKGAQSPAIFPAMNGGKKKSSSFEAAVEPSSPKVSCIGQVRVKTSRRRRKKAASELRLRSRKCERGKDSIFRRVEGKDQDVSTRACFQSWVKKGSGSDLNCFKSCGKGSCCACSCGGCGETKGRRKRARVCSCWSAFSRCWAMEIKEEDAEAEEERNERELVMVMRERGSRRGMRELELVADEIQKGKLKISEELEAPACVPPKNALLLMRCRSDPMRMASMATRFVDPSVNTRLELEEEQQSEQEKVGEIGERGKAFVLEVIGKDEIQENAHVNGEIEEKDPILLPRKPEGEEEKENKDVATHKVEKRVVSEKEGVEKDRRRSFKKEGNGGARRSTSYREGRRSSFSTEGDARRSSSDKDGRRRWSFSSEKDARRGHVKGAAAELEAKATEVVGDGGKNGELPDCLLLMMYEPKLSMEVSKETWVSSTDFIHHQPPRNVRQQGNGINRNKVQVREQASNPVTKDESHTSAVASIYATQPLLPSQSTPPPQLGPRKIASTGNITAQQASYGPFALMRCKSEPTRSAASGNDSLDGCFWRSRHHPISTAGIGV